MSRILLLEDDISLIDGLKYSLEKSGYKLDITRTVKEAIQKSDSQEKYDLLLLDVTLPDGTGFEVCEHIRKKNNSVPIIFLSAADEETSIIRGLDSGGDDYVTKPFKLGELCSRIQVQLRRAAQLPVEKDLLLKSGELTIDLAGCRVTKNDAVLELTSAEYRLLCLLIQNRNRILTRQTILDALWDSNGDFVDDNTLSVYIRRLREKVETDPSKPKYLQTVRGFGYRWNET